jgi:hypothetical protein
MALSDLAGLAIGAGDRQARTVIAWHRTGFRMFWAWKSRRGRVGRPTVAADVRALIRRMHRENPFYVKPKIMWRSGLSSPHVVEIGWGSRATAAGYPT